MQRWWIDTTKAYRLARFGGGGTVRAEAPRASTAVNYKFAPLGARNSSASASKVMAASRIAAA
jgi:hypothetical protein